VINFWDWPEDRAQEYELPWQRIEDQVKPERQRLNERGEFVLRKPLPERWWQFGEKRPGLYHAIGRGGDFERHPDGWDAETAAPSHVMVCSEVTKHLAFALIPNDYIMSANLDVFREKTFFGVCQSSLHEIWARRYSSKLETRLKYSPGNALETFVFPAGLSDIEGHSTSNFGSRVHQIRAEIMQADGIGLTKLYNRFHTNKDRDPRIEELRVLQCEMDISVARAYGWEDLDLQHGFHEVPYLPESDRVRFTISEVARGEVLRRLLELNRQRYEEEVAKGLHGGSSKRAPSRARRRARADASQSLIDNNEKTS
jgi:hypothetical protein